MLTKNSFFPSKKCNEHSRKNRYFCNPDLWLSIPVADRHSLISIAFSSSVPFITWKTHICYPLYSNVAFLTWCDNYVFLITRKFKESNND